MAPATARELAEGGWPGLALDARLMAAQLALDSGQGLADGVEADLVPSGRARPTEPVGLRARAAHARAPLPLARGDTPGAHAAPRAGMGMPRKHPANPRAPGVRVHAPG